MAEGTMSELISYVRGLISPGSPYEISPWTLRGSGRLPDRWSRDYAIIRVKGDRGTEVFNATRSVDGHLFVRNGLPHRTVVRQQMGLGKDHVHRTPKGALRPDSLGTAQRLGIDHVSRMGGPLRTNLTSRAVGRDLHALSGQVRSNIDVVAATSKAYGWGWQVSKTLERQSTDLRSLSQTASRLEYSLHQQVGRLGSARARSVTGAVGHVPLGPYRARGGRKLAKVTAKAGEEAARIGAKAAEAAAKAEAKAAEEAAKQIARATEEAAKASAKATEQALKSGAKAAEGLTITAAKLAEKAAIAAAKATELGVKAAAAAAEATIKAAAYTTAAVVSAAFGG